MWVDLLTWACGSTWKNSDDNMRWAEITSQNKSKHFDGGDNLSERPEFTASSTGASVILHYK